MLPQQKRHAVPRLLLVRDQQVRLHVWSSCPNCQYPSKFGRFNGLVDAGSLSGSEADDHVSLSPLRVSCASQRRESINVQATVGFLVFERWVSNYNISRIAIVWEYIRYDEVTQHKGDLICCAENKLGVQVRDLVLKFEDLLCQQERNSSLGKETDGSRSSNLTQANHRPYAGSSFKVGFASAGRCAT